MIAILLDELVPGWVSIPVVLFVYHLFMSLTLVYSIFLDLSSTNPQNMGSIEECSDISDQNEFTKRLSELICF